MIDHTSDLLNTAEERSNRLGRAMTQLIKVMPLVTRPNRRTGRDEPVMEVKVVLRRRTGQWFVSVGQFSSARPDVVEAITDVIERIERDAK